MWECRGHTKVHLTLTRTTSVGHMHLPVNVALVVQHTCIWLSRGVISKHFPPERGHVDDIDASSTAVLELFHFLYVPQIELVYQTQPFQVICRREDFYIKSEGTH